MDVDVLAAEFDDTAALRTITVMACNAVNTT